MAVVQSRVDTAWDRPRPYEYRNAKGLSNSPVSSSSRFRSPSLPFPRVTPIETHRSIPARSKTNLNDGYISRELLDLLDYLHSKRSRAVHHRERVKYLVLLRVLFEEHNALPSNFAFRPGDLKKRGDNPVGFGSFADIWKGTWLDTNVAIKVLRTSMDQPTAKLEKRFIKEVHIWKGLIHPHVLRFLGTAEGFPSQFAMVSPWMANGDARSYLQQHPDFNRVKLISEVASGLEYLHHQIPPISHGDLRGANILIDENECAYLSDFGLAAVVRDSMESAYTNSIQEGNSRYLAPELLDPSLVGEELLHPSPSTDMHNFGMLMFELLTGLDPYHEFKYQGQVIAAVIVRKLRPKRPDSSSLENSRITDDIWKLMECCWDFPPNRRFSISKVRECIDGKARTVEVASAVNSVSSPTSEVYEEVFEEVFDSIPFIRAAIENSLRKPKELPSQSSNMKHLHTAATSSLTEGLANLNHDTIDEVSKIEPSHLRAAYLWYSSPMIRGARGKPQVSLQESKETGGTLNVVKTFFQSLLKRKKKKSPDDGVLQDSGLGPTSSGSRPPWRNPLRSGERSEFYDVGLLPSKPFSRFEPTWPMPQSGIRHHSLTDDNILPSSSQPTNPEPALGEYSLPISLDLSESSPLDTEESYISSLPLSPVLDSRRSRSRSRSRSQSRFRYHRRSRSHSPDLGIVHLLSPTQLLNDPISNITEDAVLRRSARTSISGRRSEYVPSQIAPSPEAERGRPGFRPSEDVKTYTHLPENSFHESRPSSLHRLHYFIPELATSTMAPAGSPGSIHCSLSPSITPSIHSPPSEDAYNTRVPILLDNHRTYQSAASSQPMPSMNMVRLQQASTRNPYYMMDESPTRRSPSPISWIEESIAGSRDSYLCHICDRAFATNFALVNHHISQGGLCCQVSLRAILAASGI